MIYSSTCQPWQNDHPGPDGYSSATKAISSTMARDMIRAYIEALESGNSPCIKRSGAKPDKKPPRKASSHTASFGRSLVIDIPPKSLKYFSKTGVRDGKC